MGGPTSEIFADAYAQYMQYKQMLCIHHLDRRPAEIHESFEIWHIVS
jgi:hypothetical protein